MIILDIQVLFNFEQFLIQNQYVNNSHGFISSFLSNCQYSSCYSKIMEFDNNLNSWINNRKQIEPPIGLFLELRLFNYLHNLNASFINSSSNEIADIEVRTDEIVFQIECTHSLRKNMRDFDNKTTLRITNPFNEKEGMQKANEAIGAVDPFYTDWSIRKRLAEKAYKRIQQPFIIYFWYPSNGFSLDSTDFNDILNCDFHKIITFERSQWSKIDELIGQLEANMNLMDFKKASEDLDESIRKQFYDIITQERVEHEQEHLTNLWQTGGNVKLYRKHIPTDEQIKEYIINSLIFTYMIQTSVNLAGIIIDDSKLDLSPNLQPIDNNKRKNVFSTIMNVIKNA